MSESSRTSDSISVAISDDSNMSTPLMLSPLPVNDEMEIDGEICQYGGLVNNGAGSRSTTWRGEGCDDRIQNPQSAMDFAQRRYMAEDVQFRHLWNSVVENSSGISEDSLRDRSNGDNFNLNTKW